MIFIYPHMDLRNFLAREGIEPRGRCFLCTTTPMGPLSFLVPSPNRKKLTSTDLQPPSLDLSMSRLPCDVSHAGCIARPASNQTAIHRHESSFQSRIGALPELAAASQENVMRFALHTAVANINQQAWRNAGVQLSTA